MYVVISESNRYIDESACFVVGKNRNRSLRCGQHGEKTDDRQGKLGESGSDHVM